MKTRSRILSRGSKHPGRMKTLPMVSIYLRRMKTLLNNQAPKVKEDSSDEIEGSKEDTESSKKVKVSRRMTIPPMLPRHPKMKRILPNRPRNPRRK